MRLPRVDPVGILEWPEEASSAPRHFSRRVRAFAALLLALFALMTIATSSASLGAYCLTTEPGDVRALPAATQAARHPGS